MFTFPSTTASQSPNSLIVLEERNQTKSSSSAMSWTFTPCLSTDKIPDGRTIWTKKSVPADASLNPYEMPDEKQKFFTLKETMKTDGTALLRAAFLFYVCLVLVGKMLWASMITVFSYPVTALKSLVVKVKLYFVCTAMRLKATLLSLLGRH
jgi:hypothetical protein